QHFQGSVRSEPGEDRRRERGVLNLQEESAILHYIGLYSLNPGNSPPKGLEDFLEKLRVLFGQILDDVREVVAGPREPLSRPGLRLDSRMLGGQVRDMPPLDEIAERGNPRMIRKLPVGVYREQIR